MEVEYQLTADDLYAFQWRAAYTSPKSRRARRWAYLSLMLPFLVIALLPTIGPGGFVIARINLVFLVAVLPIVAGLYWVIERRMMRRAISDLVKQEKPEKGQLGKHKIVLGDDGLVETTAVGETRTSWAGVDRVERNDDYIFIYTAPAAAHIIPRRAFTGSLAEEFYQLTRSRTEQAEAAQSRAALFIFAALAVLSSVLSSASEPPTQAQAEPLVLEARSLIDVQRGVRLDSMLVVVRGERIVAVGSKRDVSVPEGARTIRMGNTTLLPGLIDLHVHLTLGGNPEANARATLQAGFTTVQDLGALNYRNLELRDAIAAGRVTGPRVVASGPWIGQSGGICDFSGIGIRGADAFRRRVEEDVARGVDLIKVCVSGWLQDAVARPKEYEISDAELEAAIDTAHRHGKRVAVHAISEAGVRTAVRSGADLIVHAGFPDRATVQTMQSQNRRLLPTLHSLGQPNAPPAVDALFGHMKSSVAMGLPVAFGTDAGVIPHGQNAEEFTHLIRIGLTPLAALRAATSDAAGVLGLEGQIGAIGVGKFADLIAVDGNPLEDMTSLKRVVFVMQRGRLVHDVLKTGLDRHVRH